MAINRKRPAKTEKSVEFTPDVDLAKAASPAPTFDVNDPAFQAIVAEAVTARLAVVTAQKAKVDAAVAAMNGKSDRVLKNELATVRAFKRLGIKDIQPHVNVLTFNKWVSKGFRPKEGSKAVKVANLRLWHASQVRPITAEEKATLAESQKAAIARHATKGRATVTELHPAS